MLITFLCMSKLVAQHVVPGDRIVASSCVRQAVSVAIRRFLRIYHFHSVFNIDQNQKQKKSFVSKEFFFFKIGP